jgi:hypothetical protein
MGELEDMAATEDDPVAAAGATARAEALEQSAASGAMQVASDAVAVAFQVGSGAVAAAMKASGVKDVCVGPPFGAFLTGSPNVFVGGFPMPGWMRVLAGLGKLLKFAAAWRAKRKAPTAGYPYRAVGRPRAGKHGAIVFQQERPMSCVIACVRMIIAQFTSRQLSESGLIAQLRRMYVYRVDQNWQVNGTDLDRGVKLLKANGVPQARLQNGSFDQLKASVAANGPVIAFVVSIRNDLGDPNGNHAVVVDRIQDNPDGSTTVFGRDPGDGSFFLADASTFERDFVSVAGNQGVFVDFPGRTPPSPPQ